MNGKVEALQSQFKLKFNMILNLLRAKNIKMVDILRRSLSANLLQVTMHQLLKESLLLNKLNHSFIVKFHGINFQSFDNSFEFKPSILNEYLTNGSFIKYINKKIR